MKKSPLLTIFFATSLCMPLIAQTIPNACGPQNVSFTIKNVDATSIPAPASGMATIVFLEDQLLDRPDHPVCIKCETTLRYGIDGQWVAASKGFSHASISVAPGEHHFCVASNQPIISPSSLPSHNVLSIEAGRTYFIRARVSLFYGYATTVLDLAPINNDEGNYLTSVSKQSTFTAK